MVNVQFQTASNCKNLKLKLNPHTLVSHADTLLNLTIKEIVLFLTAPNTKQISVYSVKSDTISKLEKLVLKMTSIVSITIKMEIVINVLKSTSFQV